MQPKEALGGPPEKQARIDLATSNAQTQITAGEFRRHVRQVWQIATAFCAAIIAFVAVSLAVDVHILRTTALTEIDNIRAALKTHNESMEWRADTLLRTTSELEKTLDRGIFQVRVQVQQSSEEQQRATKATATVARAAVQQAVATTQLVERVAETAKPVVNVEAPKPLPPVVVTQPAPSARPVIEEKKTPDVTPEQEPQRKPWWKYVFPWNWGRHDDAGSSR